MFLPALQRAITDPPFDLGSRSSDSDIAPCSLTKPVKRTNSDSDRDRLKLIRVTPRARRDIKETKITHTQRMLRESVPSSVGRPFSPVCARDALEFKNIPRTYLAHGVICPIAIHKDITTPIKALGRFLRGTLNDRAVASQCKLRPPANLSR